MTNGRILTIGYGNRDRGEIVQQMREARVRYVVDVRSSPYSRFQPDFSRESLERCLREAGLKYVFMGDLLGGRPKDDDCYTAGKVDYTKTRTKDFFVHGLTRLKNAYKQNLCICLMCSEGQPSQCHRSKLIGAALSDCGIDVVHMLPDGSRRTQAQVIAELTSGQGSLFSEQFFSRKVYR